MPDDAEDGNNNLLRGVVLCSTSLPQELRVSNRNTSPVRVVLIQSLDRTS